MQISIRNIGNSKGIVIPKTMLQSAGLDSVSFVNLVLEQGSLVLKKPKNEVRHGWDVAAEKIAAHREDTLVMGEFANADDKETLEW